MSEVWLTNTWPVFITPAHSRHRQTASPGTHYLDLTGPGSRVVGGGSGAVYCEAAWRISLTNDAPKGVSEPESAFALEPLPEKSHLGDGFVARQALHCDCPYWAAAAHLSFAKWTGYQNRV